VAPDTLIRAAELGINPKEYLSTNDAHISFETLGDQVITGPTTLTNVNDFRAILMLERRDRPAS
jgi:glycerate 2-kinase